MLHALATAMALPASSMPLAPHAESSKGTQWRQCCETMSTAYIGVMRQSWPQHPDDAHTGFHILTNVPKIDSHGAQVSNYVMVLVL